MSTLLNHTAHQLCNKYPAKNPTTHQVICLGNILNTKLCQDCILSNTSMWYPITSCLTLQQKLLKFCNYCAKVIAKFVYMFILGFESTRKFCMHCGIKFRFANALNDTWNYLPTKNILIWHIYIWSHETCLYIIVSALPNNSSSLITCSKCFAKQPLSKTLCLQAIEIHSIVSATELVPQP
jgi:hypothetical protein